MDEPPSLASIRRLHADDADALGPTDEWYETERLTGHITGGTPTTTGGPPAPADRQTGRLDWRHVEAPRPPTVLERLRRSLPTAGHRRRRRVIVSALALGLLALMVVGIASRLTSAPARPPQAHLGAAIGAPSLALSTITATTTGVVAAVSQHVGKSQARGRVVSARRRPRNQARRPSPGSGHRARSSSDRARLLVGGSGTSASGTPPASGSSYPSTSSSSSSASSSDLTSHESAPAPTRSVPQPAGPAGLGSQVGGNCNPKCG